MLRSKLVTSEYAIFDKEDKEVGTVKNDGVRWSFSSWSKGKLLQFVEDVCGLEWCGKHSNVIGFRIMRHTNVSNGYPLYSIEAHGKVSA